MKELESSLLKGADRRVKGLNSLKGGLYQGLSRAAIVGRLSRGVLRV